MVGTLSNAFSARYLYTFFGVITLGCIWLALSMHFRLFWCDYVGLYMVGTLNAFLARYLYFFGVITLGCIWLALSMYFRRGICILFWCEYVGLYMVGTLLETINKNNLTIKIC